METGEHIDRLREAAGLLSAAAAQAGPDGVVPSCPDWVVRDLVRHQGSVHRWAASIVGTPRTVPWDVGPEDVVTAWPDDADLLAWFDAGADALAAVLSRADPGVACWTFLPAPSPLEMWARRQAHETTVHRVDAELAAGRALTTVPAAFAADGVGELLEGFVPRGRRLRSDVERTLRVRCSDLADASWLVSFGPDKAETTREDGQNGEDTSADCVVTGAAEDLYLALWNRRETSGLDADGDRDVLDLFSERVTVR